MREYILEVRKHNIMRLVCEEVGAGLVSAQTNSVSAQTDEKFIFNKNPVLVIKNLIIVKK